MSARVGQILVHATKRTRWAVDREAVGPAPYKWWLLRNKKSGAVIRVKEPDLLRNYELSKDACRFPDCPNASHGHGLCMGHLYQRKRAGGDEANLKPLHSYEYGSDAVRLDVRGGFWAHEIEALAKLGATVGVSDPREYNPAYIGARHLVKEYGAGRATLCEGDLPAPPPSAKARICLAHVGGDELKALTALGESLAPRDGNDRVPAQRALRHLLRAYSAGLLVLTPA